MSRCVSIACHFSATRRLPLHSAQHTYQVQCCHIPSIVVVVAAATADESWSAACLLALVEVCLLGSPQHLATNTAYIHFQLQHQIKFNGSEVNFVKQLHNTHTHMHMDVRHQICCQIAIATPCICCCCAKFLVVVISIALQTNVGK